MVRSIVLIARVGHAETASDLEKSERVAAENGGTFLDAGLVGKRFEPCELTRTRCRMSPNSLEMLGAPPA